MHIAPIARGGVPRGDDASRVLVDKSLGHTHAHLHLYQELDESGTKRRRHCVASIGGVP
jgi:hypothetical protein